ncbi:MAG: hypothetical protein MUC96_13075 [Myxococcaceae bacterium]|jgi:hypothetical protein|nr:hypothetical protein [Myxococcaceae bacterium]
MPRLLRRLFRRRVDWMEYETRLSLHASMIVRETAAVDTRTSHRSPPVRSVGVFLDEAEARRVFQEETLERAGVPHTDTWGPELDMVGAESAPACMLENSLPLDLEVATVLADTLAQQGFVTGALAALLQQGAQLEASTLLDREAPLLFGCFFREFLSRRASLTFRDGFINTIPLMSADPIELVRSALTSTVFCRVRRLSRPDEGGLRGDHQRLAAILDELPTAGRIEELVVRSPRDVGSLARTLPAVETIRVCDSPFGFATTVQVLSREPLPKGIVVLELDLEVEAPHARFVSALNELRPFLARFRRVGVRAPERLAGIDAPFAPLTLDREVAL